VPLAARLAGLSAAEQDSALLDVVRSQTATVLGHGAGGVVPQERGFLDMGLDSLTAVELRNRLAAATGLRLPATLVFDHPTPYDLAVFLRGRLVGDAVDPVLEQLDLLAGRLAGVPDAARAGLRDRVQGLLALLGGAPEATDDGVGDRLDASTDDEIFDFIDNELRVSRMEED
jgi:acyl carrier protein